MEAIQTELINLLFTVITVLIGMIGARLTGYLKKKGVLQQIENNKELVRIVVDAVEQSYQFFDGAEKFEMAKQNALTLLNEKGITITENELELLIESAVIEAKRSYHENA